MGRLYATSIDTTSPTFARLVDDRAILAQWVRRALQTPRGFYWSAPEYGCDLRRYMLAGLTPEKLATIPAEVQAALETDQRIARVDVTATTTFLASGTAALRLDIEVTPKDTGPFSLTAKASADLVDIIVQGL